MHFPAVTAACVRHDGAVLCCARGAFFGRRSFAPPLELVAPLGLGRNASAAGGARPVVITFGSMLSVLKRDEQTRLLSACVRAGCELSVGAIIFTKGACPHAPACKR